MHMRSGMGDALQASPVALWVARRAAQDRGVVVVGSVCTGGPAALAGGG